MPSGRMQRRLGVVGDADPDDDAGADQPDTALSRWLPDAKSPNAAGWLAAVRADPGRAGAVALAVIGAVAVLVTVFTLVRDKPAVASAKLPPVQTASSAVPTPSAGTGGGGPVVVSVVGLVHKPGLVTLTPGARIADALSAAGGALDGADLLGLNMARRVADGEQIIVGIAAPPGQPAAMGSAVRDGPPAAPAAGTPAGGETGSAPASSVDLNAATVEQLEALPGIGPVTAAAIVGWRDAHGGFTAVDQLGEVDGIGPARLEKLRELVHV